MKRLRTAASLGIAAALAACTLSASPAPAPAAGGCPAPIAVAHRGDSALAPEETAPAVVSALRGGADVVEFDVRFTKNHVAVLMHDATVNRTTNGSGYVSAFYFADFAKLDAGSKFSSAYAGTHPITLGAALRLMAPVPGVRAIPEIKGSPTDYELSVMANAIAASSNGMVGRVIVQGFSAALLARFHAIAPTVPLALTTDAEPSDPVEALKAAHATYWLPRASALTADHLAAAQAAGIKVWPWTVDTAAEWDRLATLGVDGILTNRASSYVGWATARCGVAP